jgi:hypothetical protein
MYVVQRLRQGIKDGSDALLALAGIPNLFDTFEV